MPNVPAIVGGVIGGIVAITGTAVTLWFFFGRKKQIITLTNPDTKVALRIIDRQLISHDTIQLKLGLDSTEHILGLPVGNHVYLSARINGSMVVRPYTPISLDSQPGYVDFVIKVYAADIHHSFPNGGKMSQYLKNIPLGQYVDVRGPDGNLHYLGDGKFDIKPDARSPAARFTAKTVSMICGGSGITPMFQLLRYILTSPKDTTRLALLFANKTEDDILLRDELEALQTKYPNQFRLWYTVSKAPENWDYSVGHIDDGMIAEHIYPPGDDTLVLLCGPNPMIEFACYPNLAKLNYPRDRIYTY